MMKKEQNSLVSNSENRNCLSDNEIETELLKVWEDLDPELYRFDSTEFVRNATPSYAEFLFAFGLAGYCFYIPQTNKYYHIWRDGNFYHGYYMEIKEFSKNDILEILHKKSEATSICNKNIMGFIKYIEELP